MRSDKNLEKEIIELSEKFNNLEVQHNRLFNATVQENRELEGRVSDLEHTNSIQSVGIDRLNKIIRQTKKMSNIEKKQDLTTEFKEGEYVQITNTYKGQFGVIGKIYRVTSKQVHLTDIKTGHSVYRAFHNVKRITLSNQQLDQLRRKEHGHGKHQR